jgi:hypothetical protein
MTNDLDDQSTTPRLDNWIFVSEAEAAASLAAAAEDFTLFLDHRVPVVQ